MEKYRYISLFLQWPKKKEKKEEEIMEEAQKCQNVIKEQFLVYQRSALSWRQ